MQTVYYETSNFIQHSGNMVDLEEFRRKMALAQQDSLARQPEQKEETEFRPIVLQLDERTRRRIRWERRAWTLDACASLAVVLMTLGFFLHIVL